MDSLLKIIEADCCEFVNQLKHCEEGSFLFRGYNKEIATFNEFTHNMDYRKPVNTPLEIHNKINQTFKNKFGWNIRNGAFCYGMNILKYEPFDLGYGTQYIFFPVGKFDFVYNPQHFDLYRYFSTIKNSKSSIDTLIFKNDSLANAMVSGNLDDGFSNEICIRTEEYFLINKKFAPELIEFIW